MILLAVAQAGCPSVEKALEEAEASLQQVRLQETHSALSAARLLDCPAPLSPMVAARLHGLTGVLQTLEGSDPTDALRSAWHADPDVDLSAFGGSQRDRLEAAGAEEVVPVPLRFVPTPLAPRRAWVDGLESGPSVRPGPHAVQITDPDGSVVFESWLDVFPGEPVTLATGLQPLPAPPPPAKPRKARTLPPPILLVGVGMGAAGVGVIGYSVERAGAMKRATTPEQLRARWTAHRVSRVSGLLLVAGAVPVAVVGAF